MKYCSNCGNLLDENMVCTNCKCDFSKNTSYTKEAVIKTEDNSQSSNQNNNQGSSSVSTTKKNGLAIAGFVLSLVSILCCGATSWIGLIFSIIGLCESKKYNNDGKSLAIAGIIISACFFVLLIILYFLGIVSSVIESSANDVNLPLDTMFIFL